MQTVLTTQRKKAILDELARNGQVLAGELSAAFGVSEDTIRRDLRELAAQGRLQRVHGGALPASAALASFEQRQDIETAAKRRIARRAVEMIAPGANRDRRRRHHVGATGPGTAVRPARDHRHA
ncbi:DeoR/GlpR family transcriptional regulator of sugar metabolism [Paraburkholderia sp. WC7.3d]